MVRILSEHCDFSKVQLGATQVILQPGAGGWGNLTPIDSCEERLRVVKEIRLGTVVSQLPELLPRHRFIFLERDPRAILASRKSAWPRWSDVISEAGPFDHLGTELHAPAALSVEGHKPAPFNASTGTGHPYSQGVRSLCRELSALKSAASAAEISGLGISIRYEELLRDPKSMAMRVLEFSGLRNKQSDACRSKDACELPTVDDDELWKVLAEHVDNMSTGACRYQSAPFSVCRNRSAGNGDSGAGSTSALDVAWRTALEPWEIAAIETAPECAEILRAQGHVSSLSATGTSGNLASAAFSALERYRQEEVVRNQHTEESATVTLTFELQMKTAVKKATDQGLSAVHVYYVQGFGFHRDSDPLRSSLIASLTSESPRQSVTTYHGHLFEVVRGGTGQTLSFHHVDVGAGKLQRVEIKASW
eukprot:TRINITY_DN27976_c0_g1_i1.p1 TRINITY_DN27976_c0_g1~~TRINITY_DN27976_c0_g1_i1.p1  ORF type:complete len:489 (+),score=76.38 TRINITY_DN27976_c0_g1_i1:207-1469(+)